MNEPMRGLAVPKTVVPRADPTRDLHLDSDVYSTKEPSLRSHCPTGMSVRPPINLRSDGCALNGTWVSLHDGEVRGQIRGASLEWPDGGRTPLKRHGDHVLSMNVGKEAYTGFLTEHHIKWCDGDVWGKAEDAQASRGSITAIPSAGSAEIRDPQFTKWQHRAGINDPVAAMVEASPAACAPLPLTSRARKVAVEDGKFRRNVAYCKLKGIGRPANERGI